MKTVGERLLVVGRHGHAVLALASLLVAAPVLAQATKTKADPHAVAENRIWIDEHARWQSEHLAAARRLEAVIAELTGLNSTLDDHGAQVRAHGAALAKDGDTDAEITAHALLRVAHEEERIAHHDLMNSIELLELEIAKEQARERTDRIRERP